MKTVMEKLLASVWLATVCATSAAAQSQGDITLGFGFGLVEPKSGNGTLAGGRANVGNSVRPTFTAEYFIRDNVGVELLLATPFDHGVSIAGIGSAGSVRQLPPTLSLNYHFPTKGRFKPYVGAGLNYTTFFEEESALGSLELDDSFGAALQVGLDYELPNGSALRANLRWIDIDSDVTLDDVDIGEAEIDPFVLNFGYVIKF